MSDYLVITARSAQKDLDALPVEISSRIYPQINALASVPRPPGCLKLKGKKNGWRIRVGDYRVIYTIDDDSRTIDISKVRHRREVYQG
ncbi:MULTISPECIES: type II toxin-antitoxin system RelE/ParE family toxin [unclassified Microcoleus]|jgi:mRNA interferase RelE/StbE|uniref:type II toxin-antitoxin system RelE family toxin n=1 Tax=unclassified Microcoleus TaxID=2642155 RepID=UPI001D7FF0C3|nr:MULTISPECIES: type II toxin-antitoxin system RelE/ParE family toxin [unclassified Microcoleus]MCC3429292.1 type II toxin-antitoxin system RelE/ParE family toxin [Microcoleus sp. PH2017_04_SCI_O_A]MCC3440991.1 type II toxin-antitoxin system RelE/ParE family toxin [Microcoleus sp. PH2017_03_ELD_O_A]MCC3502254.1 type II toxin-antitoxin system RelE/ParE family toxin [Microcoleus sp. PH2017_19_SFW_U_A]TAE16558.1 MAG: type II toxin-antitoxin system RelE/ParE family toxin [Oscillatoriales cyanobact